MAPGAAPAAAGAQRLSFTRLLHGSARVAGPISPRFGTSTLVIDTAENARNAAILVSERNVGLIERTPWRRQFVVGVFSLWPTRGYDVSIRRISLQHIGGGVQQLCIVAALHTPAPGRVVLQERTSVYDLVQVERDPTNLVAPSSVVVRGVHGRLLYANKDNHPVRPDVCHAQ